MDNLESSDLQWKINSLGEWWEDIDFGPGIKTGPGRSKKLLWEKLSSAIDVDKFKGQKLLDLGCNAGGNLVQLSKFKPSELVGVEGNEMFYKQAKFVVDYFKVNAQVLNSRFKNEATADDYKRSFGTFDTIFCFGLIYHFSERLNIALLKYIRKNSQEAFFSTQTTLNENRQMGGVDWKTTREGTLAMFKKAGYSHFEDIYIKNSNDDWSALTNDWYFLAK